MNNHQAAQLPGQSRISPESMKAAIAVGQLSLDIYSKIVGDYLVALRLEPADHEVLQDMAKKSRTAAKVYYESLGIRFE